MAFAVFEAAEYGVPTTAAALLFFALPDLARLAGARPPGVLYQAVNRVWIPLAVLVGYTFGPIVWPPLFTAGLGWLARIAVQRTFGRGLVGVERRTPGSGPTMNQDKRDEDKPLADRRDDPGEPEPDFADEHTPGPTDPPNAEADTPGGEDDGYTPQTRT
ncbi:hypothetical protein AB0L25_37840 [Spirillospora sp. NPDC052242]